MEEELHIYEQIVFEIIVISVIAPLGTFSGFFILDQIVQYGALVYVLLFLAIMFSSTIVGGPIPDNTLLLLIGASAMDDNLSLVGLFIVATIGGFVGFEINYWGGRLSGLKIFRGIYARLLKNPRAKNAFDIMDRYGPVALIFSRFTPTLNLPSFIYGVDKMEYHKYAGFNLISSAVWCGTLLLLGYYLGTIPLITEYIDDITDFFLILLALSIIIVLAMFARDYMTRKSTE